MILNLLVLFIVANLAIGVVLHFSESNNRPFAEPALRGQSVNLSPQGFRIAPEQGPWPIDQQNYNVFFFGGAATEGDGVSDEQTIPVYFQSFMQNAAGQHVCTYNFGRPGCTSTQERILFEQLLEEGARPNLVVFIDGANDFISCGDPAIPVQNTYEMETPTAAATPLLRAAETLPVSQAAQMFKRQLTKASPVDFRIVDPIAISQYVFNKTAVESIARAYDISTVFVFQPTPAYRYDLSTHEPKLSDWDEPGDQFVVHGYPLMAQYVKDNRMGDDFLWLANVQRSIHKPLYLDKWHYNSEFSQQIAAQIYNFMQKTPASFEQARVGDAK
jgi:hypothetical protein